jgi:NAD(P)-dependent dehydrogenase (short-subunit alcohol dehydrogenase family)
MTPRIESESLPHMSLPTIKTYPDKFEGQVALVTGAAQGIGQVTSELFAAQGADVVLVDIQKDKLEAVVAGIKGKGGKASYHVVNVGIDTQVNALIEEVIQTFGHIDILVHLAAVYPFIPIIGHTTEDYYRIMNVSMDACFFLTRAVLPHMNKRKYGRIINTSSGTLQLPDNGLSVYVAAKSAVVGFTRSTAVEAGEGVTANIILPGLIRTEAVWNNHVQPDGSHRLFDMLLKKQCIKRHGQPEDIARTILFIASPESAFTTGQIFDVGGGATFH